MKPKTLTLKGKTVVVTGGSMGIGFAIAKHLSQHGADLILVARHEKELEKAAGEIRSASEARISHYVLDVGRSHETERFAVMLKRSGTVVHGLVNAAGAFGPIGKTGAVAPEDFEDALRTNLLGTFNMCHYLIPFLKASKRGKIVNLSGGGAAGPFPNYSAYAASKAGVVRLTENIGMEYERENIEANAIAPGFVVTRIHEGTLKAAGDAGREYLEKTRLEIARGGTPVALTAELASFLLSPASDGITGKLLSAPWDPWKKTSFVKRLRDDKDFCALRRVDGHFFEKIR